MKSLLLAVSTSTEVISQLGATTRIVASTRAEGATLIEPGKEIKFLFLIIKITKFFMTMSQINVPRPVISLNTDILSSSLYFVKRVHNGKKPITV